ncbi:MAG: O-antigen ligase family protein [Candidatus Paceibacterota bacterium]
MLITYQLILFFFFLAFAWFSNKKIKNGVYGIIFLLPTYLVRFLLFGIPTTALEIMIYILFVLWFLENRKNLDVSGGIKKFYKSDRLLFWGISFLLVGVVLSTVNSINLRTSLGIFKGWFVDPFLFFIIFTSEIKNQKQITNTLMSFVLSGFAVALVGIAYAINNMFTFDGRLRAFYESPNYLAMYLAPAFLFAVYLFIFEKDFGKDTNRFEDDKKETLPFLSFRTDMRNTSAETKYHNVCLSTVKRFFSSILSIQNDKKWQVVILLVILSAVFLTKSYGAILGIAVALLCFLLKRYQNRNIQFFADNKKTLTTLVVVALVWFSFLTLQKYEQLVNAGERSSLASRFMIWDASHEMLNDSPFFGIGPGTFQQVYLNYQSRFSVPYLEWAVAEPHNTFLAFYLQSGLIGLVGFLLLLFWLLKKVRISDIIFLFLIYFFIHSLVDTLYWKNDLAMIFWLVVGGGFLSKEKQSDKNL